RITSCSWRICAGREPCRRKRDCFSSPTVLVRVGAACCWSIEMWRQILVTGATGALGAPLVAALLRARSAERIGVLIRDGAATAEDRFCRLVASLEELRLPVRRLFLLAGDLSDVGRLGAALCHDTEVIVHAAADTNFRSPPALQDRVNVAGTQDVIDWA